MSNKIHQKNHLWDPIQQPHLLKDILYIIQYVHCMIIESLYHKICMMLIKQEAKALMSYKDFNIYDE